ncbi:uncharacterized protein LOC110817143 isoform X2 [Carica papaya]|uniref:uncharacterized protein LOC110817143 isoform X2 n=1 Tax=Carica papaya TaxID=3649 RepID=UPI000B8CC7D4|nr:uncharacterized protein LOC110817143 isoform X2 [Carica papaya]
MSLSLKFSGLFSSIWPYLGFREFSHLRVYSTCRRSYSPQPKNFFVYQLNRRPICSINCSSNNDYGGSSDATHSFSPNDKDENTRSGWQGSLSSKEVLMRLRRYGVAGILSYGLLNTAYYLTTFLLVWFFVAPVPGRMGYIAAVERFLKVMAMVWAGSQVTKLVRAGGALALAPVVDRGLSWFTVKFKFESQGKAFMVVVGFCFGLALLLFLVVTLLWA